MSILYKYRLYCNVENEYVSMWSETVPTLCPHDHLDRTNITSIVVIETMANDMVICKDSAPGAGWYQSSTVKLEIPMGTPGDITEVITIYPFDLYIWSASLSQPNNAEGDTFTYVVAPDTILGVLTQNALIGNTSVYLSTESAAFFYLTRGCEISFTDGINTQYVDRVTALDTANGIVSFETPLVYDFNIGTYLRFTVYPIRNHVMDYVRDRMFFAQKGLQAKYIPANTTIKILYGNMNGQSKNVYFQLEYYMV